MPRCMLHMSVERMSLAKALYAPGSQRYRFQENLQYKGLRSMLAIRTSLAGFSALWFGKLIILLDVNQKLLDVASSETQSRNCADGPGARH